MTLALAVGGAGFGFSTTAINYWGSGSSRGAPKFVASKPTVRLATNDQQAADRPGFSPALLKNAAIQSVEEQPLTPGALRTLAMVRPSDSARLLELAQRASRRDAATQLALLQSASQTGNWDAVAYHLDVMARVKQRSASTLTEGLLPLLAYPEFQAALVPYRDRPWLRTMISQSLGSPGYLGYASDLIDRVKPDLRTDTSGTLPRLLARYIERGDFAGARQRALSLGRIKSAQLDSFALTGSAISERFVPFAWNARASPAGRGLFDSKGRIDIEVQPGHTAILLERISTLRAEQYRFEFTVRNDASTPAAKARWTVTCASDPTVPEVWQQPIPHVTKATRFTTQITIAGCSAQRWRMIAVAPDGQAPSELEIRDLRLTRLD